MLIFATGFDAMTGALLAMDIRGRDGRSLREDWADGPHTYLGLASAGFPNLFLITGPQSPSVFSNMVVSIEQHVEWIADCLDYLREHGIARIEASAQAQADWVAHVADGGQRHAHAAGRFLVRGRQRARQAARVHAVPGRPRAVPAALRAGGGAGLRGL